MSAMSMKSNHKVPDKKEGEIKYSVFWYIWRLAMYRGPFYISFYFLMGAMWYIVPLFPGIVAQQIFDRLSLSTQVSWDVWAFCAVLVGIAIADFVFRLVGGLTEVTLHQVIETLLRRNLFVHILQRPGARALPSSTGEAISRLRDDVRGVADLVCWIVDPVGQIIAMIIALVILIRISPLITLLVFIPLLIVLFIVHSLRQRIYHYYKANQEALGDVTGLLGDVFGAVQTLKVARAELHVVEHFRTVNETRRRAALREKLLSQLVDAISGNAAHVGSALILLIAAESFRSEALTVGDLALFVAYMGQLTLIIFMSGGLLKRIGQARVSLQRLVTLLQGESQEKLVEHNPVHLRGSLPSVSYTPRGEEHRLDVLTVEGLGYHYPGSKHGITGVDLHLKRGSFTVITGRIGSGKTTLLRTLLGLLPPDSGYCRWNGQKVQDPASFFVPPRCAYTPQVPRLFSLPLKENILLGIPEEQDTIKQALQAAVLERDLTELELGVETQVGPRGVKLSGGQVQRTAAARMFVRNAELLVVDDLSSALDVETEQQLWSRFPAEATRLAVSHRRATLREADHIIVLKEGRVEAEGKLDALLESCEEMRRLWRGEVENTEMENR